MLVDRKDLKNAKRIVVKVGSSTITHANGKCDFARIDKLARELADWQNQGKEMILVTSGAVAVGVDRLGLTEKPKTIPGKQAAAAVGQGILMHTYEKIFAEYGQVVAQVLKTLIDIGLNRSFNPERLVGSGGMPSSHAATVCSLVVAAARVYGPHSAIFALSFVMAIIVMYDAMGVRRETGEQAKILNRMLTDWMESEGAKAPILRDKKLKEMVGHTPFEVLGGAIVGVAVGWAIPII